MGKYFFFFLTAFCLSFALTPLIRSIAKKANIYDLPSERKIHKKPIPLLGGIPIYLSVNITLLIGYFLNNSYINEFLFSRWQLFFVCQVIILLIGIFDDVKKLKPGTKFLFQVLVGLLLVLSGFEIQAISNIFTGKAIQLGIFSIPITIIWVVGITNALNLVDGLDGLAAGTALIASVTIFGIAYVSQNIVIALVSLILAGSLLGFIKYNFHPAKIFLGDSGSLYLGFILAVFSISGSYKGATLVAVLAPILALGLPIIDTLLSMIRRFFRSMHVLDYPSKNGKFKAIFFKGFSMFEADKDHVHHRLLKIGFSHRKTVIILYGLCLTLCALAFLTSAVKNINYILLLGAIFLAVLIGIRSLNYQEFKILENGLLLPIFDFPIINRKSFLAFIDLFAISFSFYMSFVLVTSGVSGVERQIFIKAIPIVLLLKIVILYLSGIYKRSWTYPGVEDALLIVKSILLSSFGCVLILTVFFDTQSFGGFLFFLVDFYLLISFMTISRFSFRLVNSLYRGSYSDKGSKVLIYGAGHKGSTVLKEIKHNGAYLYSPVGFIDDDIRKKGKILSYCPVLGSIDDLDKVVEKHDVAEIIVSTSKIGKDKVRKLTEFCKQRGILIKQFEFRFYEFP